MKKNKRQGFWGRFDELINNLPDYIDKEIKAGNNSVNTIGRSNTIIQSSNSSKSVSNMNGINIVSETKNGKSKITINGEQVVPKKYADGLAKQVEGFRDGEDYSKAYENYKKYLEKQK